MANPITHIALTDALWQLHFADLDYGRFVLGTSFPDIRYLATIGRSETHLSVNSLEEVAAESDDFMKGVKYHNLVDIKREAYHQQHGTYKNLPDNPLTTQALKIAEDIVLFQKLEKPDVVQIAFADPRVPQQFRVTADEVSSWYKLLADYIAVGPTESVVRTMIAKLASADQQVTDSLINISFSLAKNPQVIKSIEDFFRNWAVYLQE